MAPRLTDSCSSRRMLRSRQKSPHQECLINAHSERGRRGFSKSCWRGCFHFISQPDVCLKSCRATAGGKILGNGVWLCFICCPLQGGSNLQPTHEPVNPKPVLFELYLKKLFWSWPRDWAGHWHYQLDSYQMTLQVSQPRVPSALEAFGLGTWIRRSSPATERTERRELPRCHRPPRPESLRRLRGRSPDQRDGRPASPLLPQTSKRLRAGLGFGGRGWITSQPPGIPPSPFSLQLWWNWTN